MVWVQIFYPLIILFSQLHKYFLPRLFGTSYTKLCAMLYVFFFNFAIKVLVSQLVELNDVKSYLRAHSIPMFLS